MAQGDVKQTVKDTADIVGFISQYTSLIPSGRKMKGLSPFTNEKTPSFFVDPDSGFYYCFSSQKGGDIFSFVQEAEGVGFREALKIVADYAGIDIKSNNEFSNKSSNTPLYQALEIAQSVYQKNITPEIRKSIHSRGITEDSIQEWGIGYAPDSWNILCSNQMQNREEYVTSGLCIQKEKSVYDRFRDRVMFPFYDTQGRIIGFSGRAVKSTDSAKYINSPESPLFNKSTYLYGLNRARSVIRKSNAAMIVEGPIDAIMAHQAGFKFTVATSGTAATKEHLSQIQRLSNRLIIAFDGDSAGVRATLRVISIGLSINMDMKIAVLPKDTDPADIIIKDSESFRKIVRNALSTFEYLFYYITQTYGDKNEDLLRGVREVIIPIIATLQDSLIRESAIRDTAKFCSLNQDAIRNSIEEFQRGSVATNDVVFVRKRVGVQKSREGEIEKDQLLKKIGRGVVYIKEKSVFLSNEEKKILQEVLTLEKIPSIDYRIADIYYGEEFPDEEIRDDQVRIETFDLLKRLRADTLKKRARER